MTGGFRGIPDRSAPPSAAALADATGAAVLVLDARGRPVLANRVLRERCASRALSLAAALRALLPRRQDRRLAVALLRDALENAPAPARFEAAAPGEERALLVAVAPLWRADGEVEGAQLTAVELDAARSGSGDTYRELFEASPDGYVILGPSGRVREVNRTALRLAGLTRAQALGRRLLAFIPRDARPQVRPAVAIVQRQGALENLEIELPRPDGAERTLMLNALTTRDEAGRVTGTRVVLRDVTHRAALEKQVAILDRLAATGQLAAGVAHEINNPLQAILVHLDIVREALAPDFPERDSADRVAEGVRRIQQTVQGLLDLHRGEEKNTGAVDVSVTVREAIGLVTPPARHRGVTIVTELAQNLPPVRGNARHLYQVTLNLLLNGVQAAPRGGTVLARARHAPGAEQVEIDIADNGPGIPEELLAHIFDPFHGTRSGRGTGLGLFVTYGLVRQMGGTIQVDSQPGRGSIFRVFLPAWVADPPPGRG